MQIKLIHMKGFARRLVLKPRYKVTLKYPIYSFSLVIKPFDLFLTEISESVWFNSIYPLIVLL